jgi:hypothetical protein
MFADEYERETGHRLRFKGLGDLFPDAILETEEGTELGVEFVSVVFPFVWQEAAYFSKYREKFYEALRPARPRYQHVAIRLQLSSNVVQGPRPHRLPEIDGADGKRLVGEFRDLLAQHFDTLHTSPGVLIEGIAADSTHAFSTLLEHFNAIIMWDISQDDARKPHPEDPVIEPPIVIYSSGELVEAVCRALAAKGRKGPTYTTDILVLHTLETPGKPHFSGVAMSSVEIEMLAREILTHEQELCQRFDEIWFLNAYWTEGRRLHRLKSPPVAEPLDG